MSKWLKLGMITFFTLFVWGFVIHGGSLAAEVPTPHEFERYLEEKGDSESLQLKEQFSQLPLKKKRKLLRYFTDPAVMRNIYSQQICPDTKKVIYDGDVIIEDNVSVSEKVVEDTPDHIPVTIGDFFTALFFGNAQAKTTVKEYSASHVKKITMCGTYLQLTVSMKYLVENGSVKKVLHSSATAKKFLWISEVTRNEFSSYIMGNKAHASATWEGGVLLLKNKWFDVSPINAICHHQVHGCPQGRVTHSYWED